MTKPSHDKGIQFLVFLLKENVSVKKGFLLSTIIAFHTLECMDLINHISPVDLVLYKSSRIVTFNNKLYEWVVVIEKDNY